MEFQLFLTVALFAATMTGTPGPNNMMLTASGANFGYRRTIPHMFGIGIGLVSVILLVAAGLGIIFEKYPAVQMGLKWIASAYLLYLSWKIARASAPGSDAKASNRPMTCIGAALFQFVNPKVWVMAITAVGSFTLSGEEYWLSALIIAMAFWATQIPTSSIWAGFGSLIRHYLATPKAWRIFNGIMGVATASCLLFIW
ncbi:LysE family translocator [Endozoicomonadaceae bacterium StTr2]